MNKITLNKNMINFGSRFTRTTDVQSYANRAKSSIMARKWFPSTALYTFLTMVFFALITFLACYFTDFPFIGIYTTVQLSFLLLGIIHASILYDMLDWLDKKTFWKGFLMTLFFGLMGLMAVYLVKYIPYIKANPNAYLSATLPFVLPFIFNWVLKFFGDIPFKIYKAWYYPLGQAEPDTDLIDLSKILVIQFEFPKSVGDYQYTNFTAKAPVNMTVGQLFFIFVNEYNYRNKERPLQYLDEDGNPFGWVFHKKVSWFKKRNFFDPDMNFRENFVQNNDIIVATRTVTIK